MGKEFFGPNSKRKSPFIEALREEYRRTTKKNTTNLHNKMYAFFYEKNRLDLLAVYMMLFRRYPTKIFYINNLDKRWHMDNLATKMGMGRSTLEKKIKELIELGLMSSGIIEKNSYNNQKYVFSIASNKQLDEKFGKCKRNILFIDLYKYDTYGDVKKFLTTIPMLSNLTRQQRKVDKYQDQLDKEASISNYRSSRHVALKNQKSEDKIRKSGKSKQSISKGTAINLSLQGICRVINKKSPTTSAKYKKFLRDKLDIYEYRRTKIIKTVESREHFYFLKEEGKLPANALLSKDNKAYVKLSNIIFPSYNPRFIKIRDEYYEKHLMAYVESRITDRNITKDNVVIAKHLYQKTNGSMIVDVQDFDDIEYDINHIDIHNKIMNHILEGGDEKDIRIFATNPKRIAHDDFIYDMKVSVPMPVHKKEFIKIIDPKKILGEDKFRSKVSLIHLDSPNIALANTTF